MAAMVLSEGPYGFSLLFRQMVCAAPLDEGSADHLRLGAAACRGNFAREGKLAEAMKVRRRSLLEKDNDDSIGG